MKRLLFLFAAVALVGASCISVVEPDGPNPTEPPEQVNPLDNGEVTEDELDSLFAVACTKTGGTFDVGSAVCICGKDATLDEDSGECMLADGTPDGERGEEMRARYELMVACKETAGIYDDETYACTCPDEDILDEESGECRTAAGLPDGIRGQEAKELRFQTNCTDSGGVYDSEDGSCSCLHGNVADDGTCPEAPPAPEDVGTTS